jgi:hypothetical protein
VRVVRDNSVSAKAEGQWLTGTDERAQRSGFRAILDQFRGVVLDLVSQGHPEVLTSYLDGKLALEIKSAVESELRADLAHLELEEAAVLAMLRALARCPPSSPPKSQEVV